MYQFIVLILFESANAFSSSLPLINLPSSICLYCSCKKEDRVFIPKINAFGKVKEVFDEDWIDYHRQPNRRRYVELHGLQEAKKKYGETFEGREDVHWNIYWQYDNGTEWKESAIKYRIGQVESMIEETGREYYSIFVDGDYGHFRNEKRENLFPVKSN